MTSTGVLFGREDAVATIDALMGRGGSGSALVLVSGEAGIGRTELLSVAADRARQRGWHVGEAAATGLDETVPYSSVRLAFGRCLATSASSLDRFDIATSRHDADDTPFAAAVGLLRPLLADGPVLLAIDDAHLLDADSLRLLGALVRHLSGQPFLVLATVREQATYPVRVLADVRRLLGQDDCLHELILDPLAVQDVARMATSLTGEPIAADEADTLWQRTRGIPFYVRETVVARPTEYVTRGVGQHALLTRVLPLDPTCRALARALAIMDRVDLDDLAVLACVLDEDVDNIHRAFDRLLRACVLLETAGQFAIAHTLLRDALRDDLGPAEQRRLHRQIADALIEQRRDGSPVDLARIAVHLHRCAVPGDLDAARQLAAAAAARAHTAPGIALDWYVRATELVSTDVPEWADWTAAKLRVLSHLGDHTSVVKEGSTALARGLDERVRRAVAISVAESCNRLGQFEEAVVVLEREVGADTSSVSALNALAAAARALDRLELAEQYNRRAVDLSVGSDQRSLVATNERAHELIRQGRMIEAHRMTRRLLQQTEQAPTRSRVYGYALSSQTFAALSDIAGARSAAALAEEHLDPAIHPLIIDHVTCAKATVAWWDGSWEEALELVAQGLEHGAHDRLLSGFLASIRAEILAAQGDASAREDLARATVPGIEGRANYTRLGLALALDELDDPQLAEALDLDTSDRAVEVLVAQDRVEEAREILGALEKRGAGWQQYQWLVAKARVDQDPEAAIHALELVDGSPDPHAFEQAKIRLLLGQLDVEPERNLTQAVDRFRDLGAEAWRRKAAADLRKRGLAVPRRKRRRPGTLSEAELAMADLVRMGKTNAQIATQLSYSARTVSVYLSRIYAKLNIGNRVELARLVEEGLLSDAD